MKAEEARKLVLRLKPWLKKFLHKVHEKGGSVETEIVSDRTVFNELYPVNELFEMTRVSGHGDEHVWRLTLNEYGRYVVEECFDLLEEATEHEAANDG